MITIMKICTAPMEITIKKVLFNELKETAFMSDMKNQALSIDLPLGAAVDWKS